MEDISKLTSTQYEIIQEIAKAINSLGGKSGLISPIVSWGDTLTDNEVLEQLKDYRLKYLPQHQ